MKIGKKCGEECFLCGLWEDKWIEKTKIKAQKQTKK